MISMPELPEVETVKRTLAPHLLNKVITSVEVFLAKAIKPGPEMVQKELPGKRIIEISRRGKYLILSLDNGQKLAFHLRMTGRLLYLHRETPTAKHTVIILRLNDGFDLRMVDQRKFGTVNLFTDDDPPKGLKNLGPEPLGDEGAPWLALESLKKAAKRRTAPIKALLLDQQVIAGLGNIYTDEALFLAGINPARPANSLTEEEWKRLFRAVREVLTEGIRHRGTTRRDYVDGRGEPGDHQHYLKVYGRRNQKCPVCGESINYSRTAGRGTYYCPHCQR